MTNSWSWRGRNESICDNKKGSKSPHGGMINLLLFFFLIGNENEKKYRGVFLLGKNTKDSRVFIGGVKE